MANIVRNLQPIAESTCPIYYSTHLPNLIQYTLAQTHTNTLAQSYFARLAQAHYITALPKLIFYHFASHYQYTANSPQWYFIRA